MDMYIILCFFAVFAALVEFACINFVDTFIKRFKAWEEEEKARLEKEVLELSEKKMEKFSKEIPRKENGNLKDNEQYQQHNFGEEDLVVVIPIENGKEANGSHHEPIDNRVPTPVQLAKSECVSTVSTQDACVSTEDEDFEDIEEEEEDTEPKPVKFQFITKCMDELFDIFLKRLFRKYSPVIPQMTIYNDTLSVIYNIDNFARKLFPFVFLCLQIMYWTAYLYLL